MLIQFLTGLVIGFVVVTVVTLVLRNNKKKSEDIINKL